MLGLQRVEIIAEREQAISEREKALENLKILRGEDHSMDAGDAGALAV